jgi:hypothetical protein
VTTWGQLSIGGWRRIITRRRWRRRAVGYSTANDRARGDAAQDAGAYRAAVTACICIARRDERSKANARGARNRNKRFVHVFPHAIGRVPIPNVNERKSPKTVTDFNSTKASASRLKLKFG